MAGMIWTISNLGAGITCVILLFILLKYGTSKVHYSWAFFNLIVAIWGFGAFFVGLAKDSSTAMIFWKIALMGSIPSSAAFYHMVVILGDLNRKKTVIIFYAYSVAFYISIIFNLAGLRVFRVFNSLYQMQAIDFRFKLGVIVWVGIIFYAVIELYRLFVKSSGTKRLQYIYLLIGFVTGFTGGVINALLMCGVKVFPVGNILISIYCILVTYAILRHQLLDIEVIIRRALAFAGLLASVFAILILPTLLIQEYILRSAGFRARAIGLTISGIIIIFTMRRIEDLLIRLTDKFLFQKKYDYKELLKTFTGEVLTVLDLSKLVNVTTENLSKIIRLESCAVLIHDKDKDNYPISASLGLKEPSQVFAKTTHIINYLLKTQHYLLKNKTITDLPDSGTVKEDLKKLNAELVIPIVLHDDLMGALTLGRKKSGEDFTQDDLDILLPLSQTLAVAISNAQYFFELSKTQQEAAQKEKMAVIGTLAAGINHEICNPLGIARGQCEAFLLNKRDGIYENTPDSEQLKQGLDIMQLVIKEVDRATAITKKLSTFAKPSKGEITDDVDVAKETDEVLALIGYELRLDKIEFVKNIPPALPHIRADKKQIQEILFNLIRNAAQAISESGKITVSARVAGETEMSPSSVVIDIADTGCGIPEDKLGMIFNPFYTTKDPGKGTGLGLFIVRQVVERNKGKISLKSKVGEGTTFTLEFPKSS